MENKSEKALGKLCSFLPPEESKPVIDTLLKIIKNVLDNPNDDKYRQVRLANKKFYQQVWRHSAAQEFLKQVGWTVREEEIILQSDKFLQEAYTELRKAEHFIADIKPVGFNDEEAYLEELRLPEDDAKTFIEKIRKYGDLLPQSLLDLYSMFKAIIRSAEPVMGAFDEGRKFIPGMRQSCVKDFQKVFELLEERYTLKQKQNKSGITDNELQSIENQLSQLAKEVQALDRRCEEKIIDILQLLIENSPNNDDASGLVKELKERLNVPAKAVSDTKPLDFSHYVSSLPGSVHEFLDKQLDWDHDGVDEHLNKIADHIIDWETKLSSLLRLSDIDIYNLKEKYSEPILLRRAVLRKWKEKKGLDATYRSLLELCCKGGDARTANAICSVLKEKVQEMKEDAVPDLDHSIICPNCKFCIEIGDTSQS